MNPIRITTATLLLAAAACSELFTQPFEYGTVEVSAERGSGEPLPGVRIALYSGTRILDQGTSDSHGHLTFRLVPFGHLGVSAAVTGLVLQPNYQFVTFRMAEGAHQRVAFIFVACEESVSVLVLDNGGEPIRGAELSIYSPQEVVATGSTDVSGRHDFMPVPCGNYGVRVQAPSGYAVTEGPGSSYIDGLLVEDGAQIEVVFTLSPA